MGVQVPLRAPLQTLTNCRIALPVATGTQQVGASYAGNSNYASSTSETIGLVAAPGTPTVTLTVSPNPVIAGSPVTLTAAVTGGGPTPTGMVSFNAGNTGLGGSELNSGGVATLTTSSLAAGKYNMLATYDDYDIPPYYSQATSPAVVLSVSGTLTPTMTVTASPQDMTILQEMTQSVTVTVAVSGATVGPAPTGSVVLTVGGYTSAATTLGGGNATINIPADTLAAGSYPITVTYTPDSASSSIYSSASEAGSFFVVKMDPIVSVTPSSSSLTSAQALTVTVTVSGGTGNPTPTGSVTLLGSYNSAATNLISGSAMKIVPAGTLAAGSDTIYASYGGDAIYNQSAPPASVVVSVAKATPTVTVVPSSSSITTAQALVVSVLVSGGSGSPAPTGTVTLTGGVYTSAATTLTNGSAFINIPAGSLTLGTDSITVSYTGDANYTQATSSAVSVSVAKATLTITWSNPAAIPYGTALSATQLDATDSVAGSFSYSPTLGTVLTAGSQTLTANFTPTDTTDYTTATASVTLTVNQATPIVTWATPAAIFSGTALSATQLDATASVPGTFVYTPALGTTPAVGNDTLSVTFTPTDNVDYSAVTATVTLTVNVPLNPVPFVGNITPAFAGAGGAAFTITVNGSGFLANSTVYWGTSALTTVFVSSTELTATVTASDIAIPGATAITVQTPAPGGGMSDVLQFEVDSASASATAPTVPSAVVSVTAGSTATYSISFPASVTNATATCLNLPTGALCSFSFASGVLTISTSSSTPAGTYQVTVVFDETVSGSSSGFILLPLLLLPLYLLRKRMSARGTWSAVGLSLILVGAMAFSVGCGGSSSSSTTTTTQTTQSVTSSGVVGMAVK